MLENVIFIHAFGYMVELTVTGWCIIRSYVHMYRGVYSYSCFYLDLADYLFPYVLLMAIPTSFLKWQIDLYVKGYSHMSGITCWSVYLIVLEAKCFPTVMVTYVYCVFHDQNTYLTYISMPLCMC